MDSEELKRLLAQPEYDFLRTNSRLGPNIMLLTLGGSHAYGTNIETSDVDIRGIAANSLTDILGMTNFEQVTDTSTDTMVYSLRKICGLLLDCNPNTIEMLGCKPEQYVYLDKRGKLLLKNKQLFLSRRAVASFGGYARGQLKRLENILARDRGTDEEKEQHIMHSVQYTLDKFAAEYAEMQEGTFNLYIGPGKTEGMNTEILADINLHGIPLRSFKPMMKDLGQVVAQYSTIGKRNTKKDNAHLDKHAMHLVRLYLMGLDILEKGEINTYRDKDHSLLMDVRNGKFRLADGTYSEEFFTYIEELEKRLQYAAANTNLPDEPNFDKVQELVMEINRMTIEQAFV